MLPNNIEIMPNDSLAKSKLINYQQPDEQLSVPADVGVHHDSDLERVEQVTVEITRDALINH